MRLVNELTCGKNGWEANAVRITAHNKRDKAVPDKIKYGQLTDESRTKRSNKTS